MSRAWTALAMTAVLLAAAPTVRAEPAARLDPSLIPAPTPLGLAASCSVMGCASERRAATAPVRRPIPPGGAETLRIANTEINRAIRAMSDWRAFGEEDAWRLPLTGPNARAQPRGDCEDFVLEKRARLMREGWPAQSLSIALARAPKVGVHAVLIVHTEAGDLVLDNLSNKVLRVDEVGYDWMSMQTGEDMLAWYLTRRAVAYAAAPARPAAVVAAAPASTHLD